MIAVMLFFGLSLNTGSVPHEDDPNEAWHAYAEQEYRLGVSVRADRVVAQFHFANATQAYERLWQRGERSVALARNLGQTAFLADDLGQSIVAYRRGLAHHPMNSELRRDLQRVRMNIVFPRGHDTAEMFRPRDPVILLPYEPVWLLFVLFAVLTLVGWGLLFRAWLVGGWGRWLVGGFVVGLSIMLAGVVRWEERQMVRHWSQPVAVVRDKGADFRAGNSDEYPRKIEGSLPAGIELRIHGERGGWLQVELPNGTMGWVSQRNVSEFRPDLAH